MVIRNHIAHTFLTTNEIQDQIMEAFFPKEFALLKQFQKQSVGDKEKFHSLIDSAFSSMFWSVSSTIYNESKENGRGIAKTYYVTNTVLDILKMFRIKRRENGQFDWSVFQRIEKYQKVTFIMPNGIMLRMEVLKDHLNFCHVASKKNPNGGAIDGTVNWFLFNVDMKNSRFSENVPEEHRHNIDLFIYSLLCFVYMADNDEIVIAPGKSYGPNKKSKTLNNTNFPVTVINSRWNTTVVSDQPGWVSPFWSIRWIGEGRKDWKTVFIAPFKRRGRTTKAKSLSVKTTQLIPQ